MHRLETELESRLRILLPHIRGVQERLPTLPIFLPTPGRGPNRVRFVEEQRPNWWQLKGKAGSDQALGLGLDLIGGRLSAAEPFKSAIGKWISFPELGEAVRYDSGLDLAWGLVTTYLTAAGTDRWNQAVFRNVWAGFTDCVDPNVTSVKHVLYAPVAGMSGVRRGLRLGADLRIERLSPQDAARIATIDPQLAGVTFRHRLTLWPLTFLVQTLQLKKEVVAKSNPPANGHLLLATIASRINEETALLRALLSEKITIPTYALIRFSHPPRRGGGPVVNLPWQLPDLPFTQELSPPQLRHFQRLRAMFLGAAGDKGWESIMASVRRFAAAWDNQFRADVLADLVAALEQLLVRSDREVSYKLRVRTAFLLGRSREDSLRIANDIRDAYSYRSTIFHGGYIFDNLMDFPTARGLKRAKGKHGNPFHDVNEIVRLTTAMASYYRQALTFFIRRGQYEYDWGAAGL